MLRRAITGLSISLLAFGVSARADAQGVFAGSVMAGPAYYLGNEVSSTGLEVSTTVERRDRWFGIGAGFAIVNTPAFERFDPNVSNAVGDSRVMTLASVFVGAHSRHRVDERGAEWFGQGGLAVDFAGFFGYPELRAGVDWWVNRRRAVRIAVHPIYTVTPHNLIALEVGLVFR